MNKHSADIVERILTGDVDALSRAIREVEAKIEERKNLARDLMRQLDRDVHELQAREDDLKCWGPGYRPSIDRTKEQLKTRIHILKAEARNTELNFWKDTTALEKELRILLAAYDRAMRKRELIGGRAEKHSHA